MLAGWEISNTPDIPAEAWARSDAIGATIVKVRPYHLLGPSGAQNAAEINRRGLAVALRPDSDRGDMTVFVSQVVQCAAMLSVSRLYVILDSEPNLGSRPVEPWYWPIIGQMLDDLRLRLPSARVVSPPMAVAQRDDEWLAAGADVIRGCDYVGVHCYGQDDTSLIARSLQLAAQFGRPLLAAEVGDSHPSIGDRQRAASVASYLRVLTERGDVEAACIFIAYSRDPQWAIYQLPVDTLGIVRNVLAQSAKEEPVTPVGNEKQSDTNVWWTSIPEMVAGETWQLRGMASGVGAAAVLMLLGHLPLKPDQSTYWQDFVIPLYLTGDGPIVLDWPVPNVPLDGPITVDWSENSGLEFNLPGIGGQTFERPTVANFSCTLNPAGYATPGPIAASATPRDYVFYAAGTAYDVTQDDRYIQIQQQVNAMGGPTVPQFPISGDLATIFYAAGDGYNHDQRPEWLEVQKLVNAIKQDPR